MHICNRYKCSRLVAVASLVLVAGCGSHASVTESTDPYSSGEDTYSRNVSFGSMDRFEEAQQKQMAGDFDGAIAVYENLYQTSPSDAIKAQALLAWAQAEHSPLNPDRNADAAAARLHLLLDRYPDSAVAAEATTELASMSD